MEVRPDGFLPGDVGGQIIVVGDSWTAENAQVRATRQENGSYRAPSERTVSRVEFPNGYVFLIAGIYSDGIYIDRTLVKAVGHRPIDGAFYSVKIPSASIGRDLKLIPGIPQSDDTSRSRRTRRTRRTRRNTRRRSRMKN